MKIGVFSTSNNYDQIKDFLKTYSNVDFEYFIYDNLQDFKEAFKSNSQFLDGYFFSGYLPYLVIESEFGEFDKPVVYLKLSEADFFRKLFIIALQHPEIDYSRVFLDFHYESEFLSNFIKNLPKEKRPYIMEESDNYIDKFIYERAVQYHQHLHESGKVDWSFTRFGNIVKELEKRHIKYYYFDISNETIHQTLMELINQVNLESLRENQIVLGTLSIGNIPKNEKEVKLLNLHALLLDFNNKHREQMVINKVDDYFELTTSYMFVQEITNNFSNCSLLYFLENFMNVPIHIGWGIGKTFIQAKQNAKAAHQYSYNNKISSTFIIENDHHVIGPLISKEQTKDSNGLLFDVEKLNEIQQKTNISRDKLHKILLTFQQVGTTYISSSQIADLHGITTRSANRILKEAEEKGIVISKGDSGSGLQGRPKKLHKLNRDLFK